MNLWYFYVFYIFDFKIFCMYVVRDGAFCYFHKNGSCKILISEESQYCALPRKERIYEN